MEISSLFQTAVTCISTSLSFDFDLERNACVPLFSDESVVLIDRMDLKNIFGPINIF